MQRMAAKGNAMTDEATGSWAEQYNSRSAGDRVANEARDREHRRLQREYEREQLDYRRNQKFGNASPSDYVGAAVSAGLIADGISRIFGGVRGRRSQRGSLGMSGRSQKEVAQANAWISDFKSWADSKEPYFRAIAVRIRKQGGNDPMGMWMLDSKTSTFRLNCSSVLMYATTPDASYPIDSAVQTANASLYSIELLYGPPSDYGVGTSDTEAGLAPSGIENQDDLWESIFSTLSELEPQFRFLLLEIRAKLRERGEAGTPRVLELDGIEEELNSAFARMRRSMLQKDAAVCLAIGVDEVQPRVDRMKILVADLDD